MDFSMRGAVGIAQNRSKFAVVFLSLSFLIGCTPPPLAPTIARQTTQTVKTIVLLTPYIPPAPVLVSVAPVTVLGGLGGILGAVYDQSVQKDHAAALAALLTQQGFSVGPVLHQDITRQLQAEGYAVQSLAVDRSVADFLIDYPAATLGSGIDLDVVLVKFGYFATTVTSPYQPMVEVKYRLVRTGSTDILAQGAFQYSIIRGDQHPDPKYDYWHYRDFAANPGIAVAGLSDGLDQAAGAIAFGLH